MCVLTTLVGPVASTFSQDKYICIYWYLGIMLRNAASSICHGDGVCF